MAPKAAGRGKGRGGKGDAEAASGEMAKEFEQLEESSVQLESRLEILRAERAAQRSGRGKKTDIVREDEGIDEDDPLINVDDGIRIEPFNMRREMSEGHFDEGGFYVKNDELEKQVTDAWLDTVDQAEKSATFAKDEKHEEAKKAAASRISALHSHLGKDEFPEEGEEDEPEEDKDGSWFVEIDRSSGGRLGIGLDVKPAEVDAAEEAFAKLKGETLEAKPDIIEIEGIDDSGLLSDWNKANPAKAVKPGDRILELNGDSSTEGITGGLGKNEVLKLKFIREEKTEEPEEEKDTASMIEALVAELLPLETPVEALARFRTGVAKGAAGKPALEPLRMRARIKKDAAEKASRAAAGAQGSAAGAAAAQRPTRRRLNEWGDYEADAPAAADAPASDAAAPMAVDAPAAADAAAHGQSQVAGSEAVGGSSSSTVLIDKEAAIAAAAAKVAAQDKAVAEAAKAAGADTKLARYTVNMGMDPSKGPEAAALEEAKKRKAAADKGQETEDRASATLTASSRKRKGEPGILEQARRRRIERLTDLCDFLLERGVLVYSSTREQLAIEVRERRGEFEEKDAEKDKVADVAVAGNKDQVEAEKKPAEGEAAKPGAGAAEVPAAKTNAASAPAPLVYENKRFAPASGAESGGGLLGLLAQPEGMVDPEAKSAAVSTGRQLMWQFRWAATPEQIHGPCDSVTMHGWMTQGCFSEERSAEVRQCDAANEATEQCWHPVMEVNFGLYL